MRSRASGTIYVASELILQPALIEESRYGLSKGADVIGSIALEVMVVRHTVDSAGHRPNVFCRQPRPAL